ncbi:hypothetical protein NXW09_29380 [Bacteroides ovatus]|nr:hypothetical protein [Bacteroides ovatus]
MVTGGRADHEAWTFVDRPLFRQQVERTGASRLIVRCNLLPVGLTYGEKDAGTPPLRGTGPHRHSCCP